jgi:hypothetical protein
MLMDINAIDMIDEIVEELLNIEESAIWCIGGALFPNRNHDQVLQEFHLPLVADLLHVPVEV